MANGQWAMFIALRPLKNGFAAAQKSFSLLVSMHILAINYEMLSPISERRKTFDSLLANHFSAVMQSSRFTLQGVGWNKRSGSTKTMHIIGGTASLVPPYISCRQNCH